MKVINSNLYDRASSGKARLVFARHLVRISEKYSLLSVFVAISTRSWWKDQYCKNITCLSCHQKNTYTAYSLRLGKRLNGQDSILLFRSNLSHRQCVQIDCGTAALPAGVMWSGSEADYPSPFSVVVKDSWWAPYIFMPWCLVYHRDNFTLPIICKISRLTWHAKCLRS
jgi:hypothetical protein